METVPNDPAPRGDDGGWISGPMADQPSEDRDAEAERIAGIVRYFEQFTVEPVALSVESHEMIAQRWRAEGRTFRGRDVADEFARQIRAAQKADEDWVLGASELPDADDEARDMAQRIRDEREARGDEE